MQKKVAMRAALLVAIFAGVFGLADALNLTSGTLGAADTVVAACQTATMNATYTVAYSASQPGYQATSVVVTGLATTCWNKPYKVTLGGAAGASLGEVSGTTPGSGTTFTATPFTANAALVTTIAVVISG